MERSYLIRYGLMGQVGRFTADPGLRFDRAQTVVIRSHRGTELGEVLVEAPARSEVETPPTETARILRDASPTDLEDAGTASRERDTRFLACRRVFEGGVWPIELIDVEPLLDQGRTILHYLGPHRLDTVGVLAVFRAETDLDVMLQPVGRDLPDDESAPLDRDEIEEAHGCGSGSCGSEGGGGCGASSEGGCSDCGVKKLLSRRH